MSVNATTPSRLVSRSSTLPSIHARNTGPKPGVRREERLEEAPQLGRAGFVVGDLAEPARERAHLLRALDRERAEQLLLVGEVEVERAVRRARGRARCRRPAPRGIRARRTPASPRRAACASSCGPGRAARAPRRACRAARRRRAGRSLVGTTCTLRPCLSRGCPGRSRKPPAASRIVPPMSRHAAGRSPTPTSIASPTRSRSGSRRRGVGAGDVVGARAAARARIPARVLRAAAKLGAITAGVNDRLSERERDAILAVAGPAARRRPPTTAPPAESADDRPARVCASRARRRPSSTTTPIGPVAIIFTSGTTGLPEGRALLQPPARVHHADRRRRHVGRRRRVRSAARRSRTSAS